MFKGKVEKLYIVFIAMLFSSCWVGNEYQTSFENISIAHAFKLPIERYHENFTQNFGGYNSHFPGNCKYHAGHDIWAHPGQPVYAFADGQIVISKTSSSYGYIIVIQHKLPDDKFMISIYGHLSPSRYAKKSGDVKVGEVIGHIGNDNENGIGPAHLHFGIRKGKYDGKFEGVKCSIDEARRDFYEPCEFLDVPCAHTNTRSVGVINYRLDRLPHSKKGIKGVHWYGHYSGKIAIQDISHAGCDAAVVYDYEGGAHSAYLIKCGMWKKWSSIGGPSSVLGMPITEEYYYDKNGKKEVHQDFKNAYLAYDIKTGEIHLRYYKYATPGKLEGAKWEGEISYAFAEEYAHHKGRQILGYATPPPHGGSKEVHKWSGYYVQDFNHGNYGWSIIMYNPHNKKASLIRSGIWNAYRTKNMINILGAPNFREYHWKNDKNRPRQDFEKGYIEFNHGKLNICLWRGVPACKDCGHCNTAPEKICIPGQKVCEGQIMKECESHGRGWKKTECTFGCSNNHCNVCKSKTTWCHSNHEMQTCSDDGKSMMTKTCKFSCQNGKCTKTLCNAHTKRCIGNLEVQQCMSDGSKWVHQYTCSNGCDTALVDCKKTIAKCSFSFDAATRKVSVHGIDRVVYFTTSCADMAKKECWHKDHKTSGLHLVVDAQHNRLHPRGAKDEWIFSIRECEFGKNSSWVESPQGGFIQIK